jgi:hypothetical protein
MINRDQADEKTYTRAETRAALGIKSRVTLNTYCNYLRIPSGIHYFTQAEYEQIVNLRRWVLRGYRISDFFKHDQSQKDCA